MRNWFIGFGAMLCLSAVMAGQASAAWEYRGVAEWRPGSLMLPGDRYATADVRNSASSATLSIECRSPDGMLPARVTFHMSTAEPYDRAAHTEADASVVISAGNEEFSLEGAPREALGSTLDVRTEWQFGDQSLNALLAIRDTTTPFTIAFLDTTVAFPTEGAGAAIDQMFRACGAADLTRSAAISDFDCAVAYRLFAAIRHDIDQDQEQAQSAMERAQYALRRHQIANPELAPNSLGPQVNELARTRGERIQQGQESGEALTNDINACEAQYGFAAAGGQ